MGTLLLNVLLAFFIGSLPTGYLLGRLQGKDIRKEGSGNTGATNAARVLGKKAGILTLVIDIAKGVLGTFVPLIIPFGQLRWSSIAVSDTSDLMAIFGFITICGHCFSPFLKFKGGKGVATGLGVFIALQWLIALISVLIFALVFSASRIVSLASILATASIPIALVLGLGDEVWGSQPNHGGITRLVSFLVAWLIISRHKENIGRLWKGKEPRFKSSSTKSSGNKNQRSGS